MPIVWNASRALRQVKLGDSRCVRAHTAHMCQRLATARDGHQALGVKLAQTQPLRPGERGLDLPHALQCVSSTRHR